MNGAAAGAVAVGLSLAAALAVPQRAAFAQSINCFQSLMYGTAVPCTAAATMAVDPSANVSASPCLNYSGAQLQGKCLVIGSFFPVKPIQISVTGIPAAITNGTKSMTVNGFDINSTAAGAGPITVTAFVTVVNIGATMNVGGGQAQGTYAGTVNVNANYAP